MTHSQIIEIVKKEFVQNLRMFFAEHSEYYKFRASAIETILLKIGVTADEINEIVKETREAK